MIPAVPRAAASAAGRAFGQLVDARNIVVIKVHLRDVRSDFRRGGKAYIRVLRRHLRHRDGAFGKRPDGVRVKLACGNRGIPLANKDAKGGIDLLRSFAGLDLAKPHRNRASLASGDTGIGAVCASGAGGVEKL